MDTELVATLTELGVVQGYNTMLLYGLGGTVCMNFLSLLWLTWQHAHADAAGFGTVHVKELLGQVVELQQQMLEQDEAAGRTAAGIKAYLLELANRVGRLKDEADVMPLIPE
jgi:hypothetical protein